MNDLLKKDKCDKLLEEINNDLSYKMNFKIDMQQQNIAGIVLIYHNIQ